MGISDVMSEAIQDVKTYQETGRYKGDAKEIGKVCVVMDALRGFYDAPPTDNAKPHRDRIIAALAGLDVREVAAAHKALIDWASAERERNGIVTDADELAKEMSANLATYL